MITGAGSGIGRAIAVLFAKQGANVHIIEVNAEAAAGTLEEIENLDGTATVYAYDVTNQE